MRLVLSLSLIAAGSAVAVERHAHHGTLQPRVMSREPELRASRGFQRRSLRVLSKPRHAGVKAGLPVLLDTQRRWHHWDRVAACESSGNWHDNTGNSYYGGLQENLAFWRNYGGLTFARRPDLASEAEQIVVAERGLKVQGRGAWPVCSRFL